MTAFAFATLFCCFCWIKNFVLFINTWTWKKIQMFEFNSSVVVFNMKWFQMILVLWFVFDYRTFVNKDYVVLKYFLIKSAIDCSFGLSSFVCGKFIFHSKLNDFHFFMVWKLFLMPIYKVEVFPKWQNILDKTFQFHLNCFSSWLNIFFERFFPPNFEQGWVFK